MKLLISNLADNTTKEELTALFKMHGKVKACNVVTDKKSGLSKGYAFLEMPDEGQAKTATSALKGALLAGNPIRIKEARASKSKPKKKKTKEQTKEGTTEQANQTTDGQDTKPKTQKLKTQKSKNSKKSKKPSA